VIFYRVCNDSFGPNHVLLVLCFSYCYHPIKYGNQLMTWIFWMLSVSSVLIGNPFFIFAKKKRKEKEKKKRKKKKRGQKDLK
jgi:cytochrome c-type biogenesis protein CcmH/NrfF